LWEEGGGGGGGRYSKWDELPEAGVYGLKKGNNIKLDKMIHYVHYLNS
jgi:hypothetical protein